MRARIQDVELPFDLRDFCTPNWPQLFRYYPEWASEVRALGQEPMEVQPFMLEFADALSKAGYAERLGERTYRTGDDIIERCFAHFGMNLIGEMFKRAQAEAAQ